MKCKCNKIRLQYTEDRKTEIILSVEGNVQVEVEQLKEVIAKGKELQVEIKQYRVNRSIDSNSYLWILCQKIAEVIHSTKELVYQKVIRDVGQFELMPIKNEAVERWLNVWSSKGLGWFAEVVDDSKLEGYKKVISYYGSSCYDTKEISILINEIVDQCKDLGIETMPPNELKRLNDSWGK